MITYFSNFADGYVYVYIYDAATLEREGWNNVKSNPLKKYTLSANDLNSLKWTVTYP